MIHLETVTPDNWRSGLRVREDQRGYVAESVGILARAWAYRDSRSRAFIISVLTKSRTSGYCRKPDTSSETC